MLPSLTTKMASGLTEWISRVKRGRKINGASMRKPAVLQGEKQESEYTDMRKHIAIPTNPALLSFSSAFPVGRMGIAINL